jgi:hypothetical protein
MILFTNGCSWTYGGSLNLDHPSLQQKRIVSVWPHHLGNLLETEKTINLAMGCGSNARVLRTTLDWILNQTSEDLAKTIAVIQWTDYSRYEYYVNTSFSNLSYENIPERWARAKTGNCISNYEHDIEKTMARIESRLSTYTDLEAMYTHIAHCDALGALFKKYNIKYYYWHFGNLVHEFPKQFNNYLLTNHKWLDDGIASWNYERVSLLDAHPNLTGHEQLAEIIYNKMKEKE